MPESIPQYPPLPPDDLQRSLTIAQPDGNETLPHIGIVGDTYTITVSGDQTNGRFCVIDMHIPPGGGPPPHRHDFEETFILLQGEMEVTFRDKKSIARAGRRSLPVLAEIADQNDARYFDCLSAREKSVLRDLLTKLADHNHIHEVPTE